jgi:hypothetical protein
MLNPQLRPLFKQLQMCVEKTPVVIYTMRPQLLRYKSAVRRRLVNLRWKNEWHHNDDQVIVPPEVTEASQVIKEYSGIVPLHEQEEQDLTMSFQRLLGTAPPCPRDRHCSHFNILRVRHASSHRPPQPLLGIRLPLVASI